ncbi:Cutinase [Microbacterium sp. 77mftsu3.1]|nr:Cutinase [Microbacterium sp. 77mftsu3.1]
MRRSDVRGSSNHIAGGSRRRLLTTIAAFLGLIAALVVGPPANAEVATSKCSAYAVLITARGVDASKGSNLRDGRVWLSGGHGDQLVPLVTKMRSDFGAGFPVWTESLAWTASSGSDNFYEAQVNEGVRLLSDEIKSIIACPRVPKILLAGHSGGADVVTRTLWNLAGTSTAAFIDAAAVYGDPSTNQNQKWNAKGVSASNGFLKRTDARTTAINNGYRFYGWNYDNLSSTTSGYFPRVRAYCNVGDWACRSPYTGAWSDTAHNSYTGKTQDVFNWYMYVTDNFN